MTDDFMFGCKSGVTYPVYRIGAGRKDIEALVHSSERSLTLIVEFKRKLQTVRFSDPVLLHRQNLLRPFSLKRFERFEELFGVIADAEIILIHLFLGDLGSASPTSAVNYLLVG